MALVYAGPYKGFECNSAWSVKQRIQWLLLYRLNTYKYEYSFNASNHALVWPQRSG